MRFVAIVSWGLVSAPLLYALVMWANLPSAYSENVGFRFFWTMRWVDGVREDFIHPGQGVLLPFIQASYYAAAKLLSSDLFDQIMIVAHATLAVPTLLTLPLLLFIAEDKRLPLSVRALLVIVPAALSVTHEHLFAYHLYPDYIAYEKLLLLFSFYFYIRQFVYGMPDRRDMIWLGLLAALAASLKINIGVFVLALAFLHRGFWVAIVSSALTYGALTLVYYRSARFIKRYFLDLGDTARSWGGSVDISLFNPLASWSEHNFSNLTWLLAILALVGAVQIWRGERWRIGLCAGLALLSVYMLVKRGAGTSYLDAVVVVTLLIVLVCSVRPMRLAWQITGAAALASTTWIATHLPSYTTLKGNMPGMVAGYWQKRLYDWNRNHGLPVVAIFPSNSFVTGTIEDMMLRGFSNFAKPWDESNSNLSRKKLFPMHTLGTALPDKAVLLWVTAEKPFALVDAAMLTEHKARMDKLLRGRVVGPCYSVVHPIYGPEIRSCVVTSS